jgi:hypothetical protein
MRLTHEDVEDFSSEHPNLNHRGLSLKKQYLVIKKKAFLDVGLDPHALDGLVISGVSDQYGLLQRTVVKHAFGIPTTVEDILASCQRHELILIEAGVSYTLSPGDTSFTLPDKPTEVGVVTRWAAMSAWDGIESFARKLVQKRMEKYEITIRQRQGQQYRFYQSGNNAYMEVHFPIVVETMSLKLGARR